MYYIGIDLGGTKIKGAIADCEGKLIAEGKRTTLIGKGEEVIVNQIVELIDELTRNSNLSFDRIKGIGVAAAGQIHPLTQEVVYAPNLQWNHVPLKNLLQNIYTIPIFIDNDVRAAAWGEYMAGAGKGSRQLFCAFIGTGIGSSTITDGKIVRGINNCAGEIGHTISQPRGELCVCGNRGCLEAYSSGIAMINRLSQALKDGKRTMLVDMVDGNVEKVKASMVENAAGMGDAVALRIWEDAKTMLGIAISNVVTLINPDIVVLGGGVIRACTSMMEAVKDWIGKTSSLMSKNSVKILSSELGENAGVIGAALLVKDMS